MALEPLADVLSEFARTMVTDFPIQKILDHLTRRIVEIMPVTAAGVTLISPALDPRFIAASNEDALRFERLQTELGEGPCLEAYRTGIAVSAPDLRSEDRFTNFSPRAVDAGLAAVFTFPLRHGEVPLGALDLYRDTPGELSADSMVTAQTLADVAAAYVLNAQGRAELQDSSARSNEAALHDALTGLPNRVLMFERLEQAFRRGRRSNRISAVFFVDLDRFKAVNDTFGHRIGDELLVAVAKRLAGVLRPGDTLARLSGDEFVILCEELERPSQADAIAVRIAAVLGPPFALSNADVNMTASIGIAFTGRDSDDPGQLLHDADRAMYETKRSSVGRPDVFDLRELHLAERRAGLERALPGALGRGELHLEYQPIVAGADARLTGVEALLRWTHPTRGLVPPSVLIPLAEQSGLISEIGRWVLEQAWSDRRRWHNRLAVELAVSVNLSAHQVMSAGFVDLVADVLGGSGADPRLLRLDMTESIFLRDAERARVVLGGLREMGVGVALDDFGTGYSSLNHMLDYPVDTVKTDRVFVAKLGSDPVCRTVMTAVIQLARGLGMAVVAEGVETAEQHDELAELGCDFCQGFYFARPMPASGIDALIQDHANGYNPCLPVPVTATAKMPV